MTTDGVLGAWRTWVDAGITELALVIAVVWLVDRLAEFRLHPHARNVLWTLVLVRLWLPPSLTWRVHLTGLALPLDGPMAATSAATPAGVGVPLHWFFAVWLVGAVSLPLIWWVRAAKARRRLRELSRCDRDRLEALGCAAGVAGPSRRARVFVDPHANAPYVTGLLSAAIVLPNDWGAWPARALSHALEHEVMHLRRRDLWIEAVWMTVTACYWFHPLVHVARRRAHETREASCDAAVARRLGRGYRRSLLELAARWPALESAAGPPARHGWGPMVVRIRLLDRWPSPLSLRNRVAAALVLAAGAFAILPSHVGADRPPPAGFTLQQLTDPAARQESGLGSLHLRYELMRRNNLERSSR